MLRLLFLLVIILLFSCKQESKNKFIKYGDGFIKGSIYIKNSDTIFDGEISFYDSIKQLVSIVNYKNNLKLGKTKWFYKNTLIQEENYFYDIQNGDKIVYDSAGQIESKYFCYFDRPIGPAIFYRNNIPYHFKFINFDQQILYECKYEKSKQVQESGNIVSYSTKFIDESDVRKLMFFIYIIEPPFKKISYRIYDIDERANSGKLIREFTSINGYVQNAVLDLPLKGHKFIVRTELTSVEDGSGKYYDADLSLPILRGNILK